tara:strand:- start:545 stop:688 length:144 start_codon:yes stop_codon:yes gene_type:complete
VLYDEKFVKNVTGKVSQLKKMKCDLEKRKLLGKSIPNVENIMLFLYS